MKLYKVGGCVRDKLLGRPIKDIDYEVHGITPEDFFKKFPPLQQDAVGKVFGVYLVEISGELCEVCFPRKERQIGLRHSDIEVSVDPFLGLEKAARRRDFTINALYEDVDTGEILDPTGRGLKDIENRILDIVDTETFMDDALRPLRALRFSRTLSGFTMSPLLSQLVKNVDISMLTEQRVANEYLRMPMKYWHELPNLSILPKKSREIYEHMLKQDRYETIWVATKQQKPYLLEIYNLYPRYEDFRSILKELPIEIKQSIMFKDTFIGQIKKLNAVDR